MLIISRPKSEGNPISPNYLGVYAHRYPPTLGVNTCTRTYMAAVLQACSLPAYEPNPLVPTTRFDDPSRAIPNLFTATCLQYQYDLIPLVCSPLYCFSELVALN